MLGAMIKSPKKFLLTPDFWGDRPIRCKHLLKRGFTLLDMAIAIALIVMIGAIALPNMVSRMPELRLRGATGAMVAEFRAARMMARGTGRPVTILLDQSTPSLRVKIDRNGNGTYESNETTLLDMSGYSGVTVNSSVTNGVFDTRGVFTCSGGRWKIKLSTASGREEYVYVFAGGFIERSEDSL